MPGYATTPSSRSIRSNTSFLRLPRPHTVSAPGSSVGSPSGRLDAARGQERPHPVVPRLAVDVVEVVGVGVGAAAMSCSAKYA